MGKISDAESNLLARKAVTPAEYACQTGLSESTIRRACERREIAAIRIGRRWLIPVSELDQRLAKASAVAAS
jgi:excisionase family DNA binding protein